MADEKCTHHVLIGLPSLVESESLVVQDGVNVLGLDDLYPILYHLLATHIDSANGANVAKSVRDSRLVLILVSAKESNHADHALVLGGLEALRESARSTTLDSMVHTGTFRSQRASALAPVGIILTVDDMVGAELLQPLCLRGGRRRSDHGRTHGFVAVADNQDFRKYGG